MLTLKKKKCVLSAGTILQFYVYIYIKQKGLQVIFKSLERLSRPIPGLCISCVDMDHSQYSSSFTFQLSTLQISHLQCFKRQNKSWGLQQRTALKDFKKLVEQDKLHKNLLQEVGLAAAQQLKKSSHLISYLLCIREAAGKVQCCILICALL